MTHALGDILRYRDGSATWEVIRVKREYAEIRCVETGYLMKITTALDKLNLYSKVGTTQTKG